MHEFLSIVIGFEKGTVAGVATAELPLDTLVLTGSRGFALDPNEGWIPQMPALKDGGVWAESSTSTGRTLIAGNDGNNTISIRGNSPNGLLWRMEGVDIPNPNHFSSVGTSGGGVSILSAQLLSNSDLIV